MLKSLLNELNERKIEIEKLTERIDHLEVCRLFINSHNNQCQYQYQCYN